MLFLFVVSNGLQDLMGVVEFDTAVALDGEILLELEGMWDMTFIALDRKFRYMISKYKLSMC